jgi:nicotinate-nucleotide--dimethylbenzimidazole phosphoribosyltransferase
MTTSETPAGELLARTLTSVQPADAAALAAARDRQNRLTKPIGALGQLEELSVRLAGIAGVSPPPVPAPAAVAVFAADHGVHAQGVSPWPQEVTRQMVANFIQGGAAVNALARQAGAAVLVIDVGVATALTGLVPAEVIVADATTVTPEAALLLDRAVRRGTADLSAGPAMTREDAITAIEVGIAVANDLVAAGYRCLLTGDMGIANTTASAALIGALTGYGPGLVTGRGTGIDDATHAHKIDIVSAALERHAGVIAQGDPVEVLAALGGFEHAALTGFILAAAANRVPVILDGVIAGSAALVAAALAPAVLDACVAGHRSAEPGHTVALVALGLTPLVDLELRLGEGTGAVLALGLVQAAVAALREMSTFDAAGVTEKSS